MKIDLSLIGLGELYWSIVVVSLLFIERIVDIDSDNDNDNDNVKDYSSFTIITHT